MKIFNTWQNGTEFQYFSAHLSRLFTLNMDQMKSNEIRAPINSDYFNGKFKKSFYFQIIIYSWLGLPGCVKHLAYKSDHHLSHYA